MSMDCVLFDFATKNLHLATIFCHLVDKCDFVNFEPCFLENFRGNSNHRSAPTKHILGAYENNV